MADIETLGILEEIEALVSVKLQVVSYKWLSRNFLVSSDAAKRLLQEFVEKNGSGLEVVYSLCGWLKNDPPIYHIRLVSAPKLAEAKQEFDDSCSVQVYSVQASIPKDAAALWNAEFVQAEELFKQPSEITNCLRDNRFCGILNTFVKRNAGEMPGTNVAPPPKSVSGSGFSKSNLASQPAVSMLQPRKVEQSSPKTGMPPPHLVTDLKNKGNDSGSYSEGSKPSIDKERLPPLPVSKKKGDNGKSTGTEGLLTNLWDRASTKSISSSEPADADILQNSSVLGSEISMIMILWNVFSTADAQACAHETAENGLSDDDGQDVNIKRASNTESSRKRRVVFDFSDDEDNFEDAVNLGSPDPPKDKSLVSKDSAKHVTVEKNNLNFDEQKGKQLKPEKAEKRDSKQIEKEAPICSYKEKESERISSKKIQSPVVEEDINKRDKVSDAAPNSPKRRKVLKTRIDERGREVTEVVWEGEEPEIKDAEINKAETNAAANAASRPPPLKKSPTVGATAPNAASKTANKKTANSKDPKQGNILSFFKRV
ncbi:DNA polymerase delta subunit 3 [Dillenia turbinata]|uniref:DNA polymerase delta subunit 3 n=1 Tax=Dillenia turbinata TaxID=194707 RepID=A0AAN8ZDT9_9MAGN